MVVVQSFGSGGHVDLYVLVGLGVGPDRHVAHGVASDGAKAAIAVTTVRGVVGTAAAVSVTRRYDGPLLPAAAASSLVAALDAEAHVSGLDHTEVGRAVVAVAARPQHERRHIEVRHIGTVKRRTAQVREA